MEHELIELVQNIDVILLSEINYNKLSDIQSILYPLFAMVSFENAISINGLTSRPMMMIW